MGKGFNGRQPALGLLSKAAEGDRPPFVRCADQGRPLGLGKSPHLCDTQIMKLSIVSIDPEIMGGTPCFSGTRVPIQTLLDYVEAGDSIDEFLDGFPTVSRAQVVAYLEESNR